MTVKRYQIALRLSKPMVDLYGSTVEIELPDGCVGVLYAFKTKKAAREWYHTKDLGFREILIVEEDKNDHSKKN